MAYQQGNLPVEVLEIILDQLEPNPDQLVEVDKRRFLSQESLDRPSPPPRSCIADIANFRLACKHFAAVGAPLLFTRVVTRFSGGDLSRLERLAEWKVAVHVKRFSYLVPYFFKARRDQEGLRLLRTADSRPKLNLRNLQSKANERQQIIEGRRDARILKKAIAAFTSLQHVRILPLADQEQNKLLRLIRQEPTVANFVDLDWTPACFHCSRTIGNALLDAGRKDLRLSYPKLSPHDAQYFANQKLEAMSNIAATLVSLTLQFEEVNDLEHEVRQLSHLFRTVFSQADKLQAIHVGFLSPRPLDLPLEAVFQGITWTKLSALGIHGWSLHAEEILSLALRHKDHLRGLRLRKVSLREGSAWSHVLTQLRQSLSNLNWISLTGIGYEQPLPSGAQELAYDDSNGSDDDSEPGDADAPLHNNGSIYTNHTTAGSSHSSHHCASEEEGDDFYDASDSGDENGQDPTATAPEIEFMELTPVSTKNNASLFSSSQCCCAELSSSENSIVNDDGRSVDFAKAKAWERWIVGRCSLHTKR